MTYFPELEELADSCPEDMKLAVTAWVFRNLSRHMDQGGSFRYLVYTRMGFDEKAYAPLWEAGGLEISNFCNDVRDFHDDRE